MDEDATLQAVIVDGQGRLIGAPLGVIVCVHNVSGGQLQAIPWTLAAATAKIVGVADQHLQLRYFDWIALNQALSASSLAATATKDLGALQRSPIEPSCATRAIRRARLHNAIVRPLTRRIG